MLVENLRSILNPSVKKRRYHSIWQLIHIDILLFFFILLLSVAGLFILYSASGENLKTVEYQGMRFLFAFSVMFVLAQISPATYQRCAVWIYSAGLICLVIVLIIGKISKGGQRWLHFGILHFQPSEIMKLAIPLFLAWYYHRNNIPVSMKSLLVTVPAIMVPSILTAKQPDLGTGILLFISGMSIIFLGGISRKGIFATIAILLLCAPLVWYLLHDYQRLRVLTFLYPESDPLGAGYHIIQSKIAIGSGGIFGKGWLNGTQSNLHFLPERSTDFIFAVCGEEFGFAGSIILIGLFLLVVLRGLYISFNAQDTFSRLLAGSITLTFFVSFFINIGMVTGIVPVVGIPLPLISYGGTSMVTMMASFGMLMSIQTHRRLVTT